MKTYKNRRMLLVFHEGVKNSFEFLLAKNVLQRIG
jgi:hypothetical protein